MLFRQRQKDDLGRRVRLIVWPRRSWRRSWRYYVKRVLRLSASPNAVALGFACGAFASFLPFLGFHILIAIGLAMLVRGNVLASVIGTAIGNPLTFPLIFAATYALGQRMLGRAATVAAPGLNRQINEESIVRIAHLIEPMTVGAIPLGLAAAIVCYLVVFRTVAAYQTDRRDRFAVRRAGTIAGRVDGEGKG